MKKGRKDWGPGTLLRVHDSKGTRLSEGEYVVVREDTTDPSKRMDLLRKVGPNDYKLFVYVDAGDEDRSGFYIRPRFRVATMGVA